MVSGKAIAHFFCLQRLENHALECKERDCKRGEDMREAYKRSFEALHPREKRAFKPIALAMGYRVLNKWTAN